MKAKQIPLREYTREQVAAFLREDALDDQTTRIAKRFLNENDKPERSGQEKQAA
jgi:hypothetical protein